MTSKAAIFEVFSYPLSHRVLITLMWVGSLVLVSVPFHRRGMSLRKVE